MLRIDGSTKFGAARRWGVFPGASAKWIISEEAFMKPIEKYVSMLAIRPGWGITGNQPGSDYSQYSVYSIDNYGYMGGTVVRPVNIPLTDLRWEKTMSYNLGFDFGFFNNLVNAKLDIYDKETTDLLWSGYTIPTTSGFPSLTYKNDGKLQNRGWELEVSTDRIINKGKFSMDFNFNIGNNKNVIKEIDESIMNQFNDNAAAINNGVYLTRIQMNNSYGSIYGFRYKGVYAYSYEKFNKAEAEGKSCPVARDADGNIMYDYDGNPKQLKYDYLGANYKFQGGDAIYEDVNNDGSIDEYDVVYLGNSNPKLEGGFGSTLRYGSLSLTIFCNFRYGGKIINNSRMSAEICTPTTTSAAPSTGDGARRATRPTCRVLSTSRATTGWAPIATLRTARSCASSTSRCATRPRSVGQKLYVPKPSMAILQSTTCIASRSIQAPTRRWPCRTSTPRCPAWHMTGRARRALRTGRLA